MAKAPISPLTAGQLDVERTQTVSFGAVAMSAVLLLSVAGLTRLYGDPEDTVSTVGFLVAGIAGALHAGGLIFSLLEKLAGRSIRRGDHLAHWVLPPLTEEEAARPRRRAVLPVAGAVMLVIPFMLLFSLGAVPAGAGPTLKVLAVVVLLLPTVALPLLFDRIAGKIKGSGAAHPEEDEVLITFSGVLLRGEWHRWVDPNNLLTGGFDPRRMAITLSYKPPSDPRSSRTVVVPVPAGHEAEARRVLAGLGLSTQAPAAAAIRSSLRDGPEELWPHPFRPRLRRTALQVRREPVLVAISVAVGVMVLGLSAPVASWRYGLLIVATLIWAAVIAGLMQVFDRARGVVWRRVAASSPTDRALIEVLPAEGNLPQRVKVSPVAEMDDAVRAVRIDPRLLDGGHRTGDPALDKFAGVDGPHMARIAIFDRPFRAAFAELARSNTLWVEDGSIFVMPTRVAELWPPAIGPLRDALIDLAERLVVPEAEFAERVITAAKDFSEPAVCADALVALHAHESTRTPAIELGMLESGDPRLQLLVGEIRGPAGVELIEPLATNADPAIRHRAARDLIALLPPMEAAERAATWVTEDNARLQTVALLTAACRGLPAFAVPDAVLRALPVDVALDVIGWVSRLPSADAQPILIALFGHPEKLVAISALHAIGANGTPAGLAAVHRSRANPDLVDAALRAVDRIKNRHSRRVGGRLSSFASVRSALDFPAQRPRRDDSLPPAPRAVGG